MICEAPQAVGSVKGHNKPPKPTPYRFTCPECATVFKAARPDATFCSAEHKRAFHNRNTVVGAGLAVLAQAWRLGRNAKGNTPEAARLREVARMAFSEMCALADAANSDDLANGRQSKLAYVAGRERRTGQVSKVKDAQWSAVLRERQARQAEAAQ